MLKKIKRSLQQRKSVRAEPPPAPSRPAPRREAGRNESTSQSLIELIARQDRLPDEGRDEADYLHVSTLIRHCPRKLFLMSQDQIRSLRRVTGPDRIMWKIGRMAEAHVRESLVAQMGPERFLGVWACDCRRLVIPGNWTEERCRVCERQAMRYEELSFLDEECGVMGNPDLLVKHGDGTTLEVIEIKSKSKKLFDALTTPDAEHVLQAGCYHKLLSVDERMRTRLSVMPTGRIIYVCKDYSFNGSPYKEFTTNFEQPWLVQETERLFGVARRLKERQSNSRIPLPSRLPACATPSSTTAAGCEACASCFNRAS